MLRFHKSLKKSSGHISEASASAEEAHLRKTTSPAKVAANRRNSQKSSGPTTEEGKARSRWNSMKHGLLSERLALIDAKGKPAFGHLLASLCEDRRPQGALEEILVEKIAMDYWRLQAAVGYEIDAARFKNAFLETIDLTNRYSTSIHRQLMRDISQLERLQRQRKGEIVPAPVSIDVNVSGLEPLAHLDVQHNVTEIPGTIGSVASADAKDTNQSSSPQTAAAETQEPKGLALQGDGVGLAESGSSGVTFEPLKHLATGEDEVPGLVAEATQEILPNEPTAGSVAGTG